ncbi:hypothetical protein D3C72_1558540 [compost metagenome]
MACGGLGVAAIARALKVVASGKALPLASACTPAATLVVTWAVAMTRIASLRTTSTLKLRKLLAPVCNAPQAVSSVCPAPASKPLRAALLRARASARGPTPLHTALWPAASNAAMSAIRCKRRCSR